jgi:predicted nucleic acid-binding Zn ribbon protein
MRSEPQNIGHVLDSLLTELGIQQKVLEYDAVNLWNETVGEQIAKVATADRVEKGVLIVRVSAAPWRAELTFRKKEILEKLRKRTNTTVIKDIKFR